MGYKKPQAVILMGLQGSGKSTLYFEEFKSTHVRINLDMLKTRHREKIFLMACLISQQSFVVDNTNLTRAERSKYILLAEEFGFEVVGIFLNEDLDVCIVRNKLRTGKAKIPEKAIRAASRRLERPDIDEGFDRLRFKF